MKIIIEVMHDRATMLWDLSDQRPKGYVPLKYPRYLKRYDPAVHRSTMEIELTDEIADAQVFESTGDALELWRSPSGRIPMRPDGKMNRPMAGFTICLTNPGLAGETHIGIG